MGKFVLLYTGGSGEMGESEEEQADVMGQWMNWFGSLGESVVDGGAPFGPAHAITSEGDGEVTSGSHGYSIIEADSLEEAAEKAAGCPHLSGGGTIEIHEAMPVG